MSSLELMMSASGSTIQQESWIERRFSGGPAGAKGMDARSNPRPQAFVNKGFSRNRRPFLFDRGTLAGH